MDSIPSREIFRFGKYELEVSTRELRRDGWRVLVEEKPFQVLAALVLHAGQTVSREDLQRKLWPDGIHTDFRHGLNNAVGKARLALNDTAGNPRFIATVPKVGYRFIAPVERVFIPPQQSEPSACVRPAGCAEPAEATGSGVQFGILRSRRGLTAAVLTTVAALLLLLGGYKRAISTLELPYLRARKAGEAYAQGVYLQNCVEKDALIDSKMYLEQAIALDPNFAEAHAALAITEELIGDEASERPIAEYETAQMEAHRALALDESLPAAHVALGNAALRTGWNWERAKHEYLVALSLDPQSVVALEAYARLLGATGNKQEALQVIKQAQEMSPLSARIRYDRAMLHYFAKDFEDSITELHALVESEPEFPEARKSLSDAYARSGHWNEAANELIRWLDQIQVDRQEVADTQRIVGTFGFFELWRRHVRNKACLQKLGDFGTPFNMAVYSALLRQPESAVTFLDLAYKQHDSRLLNLKVDPQFDDIRSDPRFLQFLRRVGLS